MGLNTKKLQLMYGSTLVGTLEQEADGRVSFTYDEAYLATSTMSVSPISLPLKKGKFMPKDMRFEGLFGVFYEMLPSGFARIVLKKHLAKAKIDYDTLSPLDKLSLLLPNHFGGFSFVPCRFDLKRYPTSFESEDLNLDELRKRAIAIYEGKIEPTTKDVALFGMGRGDNPMITYSLNGESWVAELPLSQEIITDGQDKYDLYKAARRCEIETPNTLITFSHLSQGNLTIRRIDRDEGQPIPCLSLKALLELDEYSSIDYLTVMQSLYKLTKDEYQLEEMLKRLTFNVALGLNSYKPEDIYFYYDKAKDSYRLSPFVNLAPPTDFFEHQISTNWKGHPSKEDIMEVARLAGIPYNDAATIVNFVWKKTIAGN